MVRFFTVQSSGFAKFRFSLSCRIILISAFFLILQRDQTGFQLSVKRNSPFGSCVPSDLSWPFSGSEAGGDLVLI